MHVLSHVAATTDASTAKWQKRSVTNYLVHSSPCLTCYCHLLVENSVVPAQFSSQTTACRSDGIAIDFAFTP